MTKSLEQEPGARKIPSRGWYVLSAVLLFGSFGVFVWVVMSHAQRAYTEVEAMPRWIAPDESGYVVAFDKPGRYYVFYENKGEIDEKSFDTPRRQIWMTYDAPSMTCTVTPEEGGDELHVRLLGQDGREFDKRDNVRDIVTVYDFEGRQGHAVWLIEVKSPGSYRIMTHYVDEINIDPDTITIPEELTRKQQRQMTFEASTQQEKDRRDAIERMELARLEPIDVILAVGQDPMHGSLFAFLGLRGAAGLLAVCFTAASIISLVTLMLRTGQVTQRGELANVQRGLRR